MPEDKAVALVGCDSYEHEQVLGAVRRSIDLLGGLGAFVSPGMRVLVKPNLLIAAAPDRCITTHPHVVWAVALLLRDHGCQVTIADSPSAGSMYSEAGLRKAYAAAGWDKVAEELGVGLNHGTGYKSLPNPQGKVLKRFLVIDPAAEADAIVVVSKAKTHMLTMMTGAAKNLFGVVPGMEKPALHSRFQSVAQFSDMIVDLNQLMRPRLQIMDAVWGMEGDGPHNGQPRKIGAVLASPDCSALDSVAARIMSFQPMEVGTFAAAAARGLIREDASDVRLLGDPLERFVIPDFKPPKTKDADKGYGQSRLATAALSMVRAYSLKPVVIQERCVGCGQCVRICPRQTVRMRQGKARIDSSRCIRCYCCHETCQSDAIELRRSTAGKALARLVERRSRSP